MSGDDNRVIVCKKLVKCGTSMKQSKRIIIRTAKLTDASELLRIYTPYVERTAITFEYEVPTVAEFTERICHTLERYPYLVAEADGEIIGYAYASSFKERAAYAWAVETSIYIKMNQRGNGVGRLLYERLEEILAKQHITNLNACISSPQIEDEYLTGDSIRFHGHMGYRMVGEFRQCGYKFHRWYNMVWMEKIIGEHKQEMPEVVWFPEIR